MTEYLYADRLERPLFSRSDIICDDCNGAILESETRYYDDSTGNIYCIECKQERAND